MTCSRGKASPDAHTQRRLFAASAGYCQNPACARELFIDLKSKKIHVAEMAHIFAANDDGPRAKHELSAAERGQFDNLILLCTLCHTMVDKAPGDYPDSLILNWKRDHANKLQALFGVARFDSRVEARGAIEPALLENRTIFTDYGPHIDEAKNPESGAAERWTRKMLTKIIPNNRRVLAQLDANGHLLTKEEVLVVERFRQHIDDLEARHISGFTDGASRFPAGMAEILEG